MVPVHLVKDRSLFRAITLKLPWQQQDLLASSNWLPAQDRRRDETEAIQMLAEAGRTKRIRNTAMIGLNHRSER
ncbi:hypothetical protein [Streptomyces chartreusis]|uniref:hypothetical protein n=1 Tax=Streptomyces chartreusis TaxID=1969 RepID=UPI00380E3253